MFAVLYVIVRDVRARADGQRRVLAIVGAALARVVGGRDPGHVVVGARVDERARAQLIRTRAHLLDRRNLLGADRGARAGPRLDARRLWRREFGHTNWIGSIN